MFNFLNIHGSKSTSKDVEEKVDADASTTDKDTVTTMSGNMFQGLMVKSKDSHAAVADKVEQHQPAPTSEPAPATKFSFMNSSVSSEPTDTKKSTPSFSFISSGVTNQESHEQVADVSQQGLDEKEDGGPAKTSSSESSLLAGLTIHSQETSPSADPFASVTIEHDESTEKEAVQEKANSGEASPVYSTEDKDYEFVQNDPEKNEGEFAQLLRAFRRSANKYTRELKDVNNGYKDLSEQRAHYDGRLEALNASVSAKESAQSVATDAEDFSKAETLQVEIDSLIRERGSLRHAVAELKRKEEKLQSRKQTIMEVQIESIETIRSLLKECSLAESERARVFKVNAEDAFAQSSEKLNEEEDLVRMRIEHIDNDLAVLKTEEDKINEKISSGTAQLREGREEWEAQIETVDKEIEELERQLESKMKERKGFKAKLGELDRDIDAIKSKYGTRLSELEARRSSIEETQKEVYAQQDAISQSHTALREKREEEGKHAEKLKLLADSVASQLVILEKISERLSAEKAERLQTLESSKEARSLLDNLYIEVKSCQESYNLSDTEATQLKQELADLNAKLADIESKIPAVNEQKRLAVSTRNFKQAARIAAQAKALLSEKDSIETTVGTKSSRLDDLLVKMNEQSRELDARRVEAEKIEVELNKEALKNILTKRETLEKDLEQLQQLGSTEKGTFGETVVQLLETDIQSCTVQADELADKLGVETTAPQQTANPIEPPGDVTEILQQVDSMDEEIGNLTRKIDKCVAAEEYEIAAELEEECEQLKCQRESLVTSIGGDDALETLRQQEPSEGLKDEHKEVVVADAVANDTAPDASSNDEAPRDVAQEGSESGTAQSDPEKEEEDVVAEDPNTKKADPEESQEVQEESDVSGGEPKSSEGKESAVEEAAPEQVGETTEPEVTEETQESPQEAVEEENERDV